MASSATHASRQCCLKTPIWNASNMSIDSVHLRIRNKLNASNRQPSGTIRRYSSFDSFSLLFNAAPCCLYDMIMRLRLRAILIDKSVRSATWKGYAETTVRQNLEEHTADMALERRSTCGQTSGIVLGTNFSTLTSVVSDCNATRPARAT